MDRYSFIEKSLRQIYGGQPSDDANISYNLVNLWLNEAIGIAAKANYTDAIKLDGIGYVNNSFYTTFKGLTITPYSNAIWKFTLPQIPIGIGRNEGVNTVQLSDSKGYLTQSLIPISANQKTYFFALQTPPNKTLYYTEGSTVYILSTTILSNNFTATVSMISGGDSTDLNSEFNVPDDYHSVIVEYIKQQLGFERQQPVDTSNNGLDAERTSM